MPGQRRRPPLVLEGPLSAVGNVARSDVITLTFPIFERTDKVRIEKQEYTLSAKATTWCTSTRRARLPLYQREKYREDKAHTIKVKRFVSRDEVAVNVRAAIADDSRLRNNENPAAAAMTPIDLREIKIGGEIGRRIDITVYKNLLALNIEKDFLLPSENRISVPPAYVGLGKLIDATVRFAAYTNDDKGAGVEESSCRRGHQDSGAGRVYRHPCSLKSRLWGVYDVHEMSYLVLGLTNDYKYFGEKSSLAAARKLADYVITRWSAEPSNTGPTETAGHMYGVTTGLDGRC